MLISRNFFTFTYDYRREWLRFIRTLSDSASQTRLHERAVRAMADVFECSSGALFLRGRGDMFAMAGGTTGRAPPACWRCPTRDGAAIRTAGRAEPARWAGPVRRSAEQAVLNWVRRLNAPWLLVPLRLRDEIVGAIVLSEPRVAPRADLGGRGPAGDLRCPVGSYIAEEQASRALFEAQRFERLGQSFSFVAHDLKNMVSQLSLILQHAERHGDNPEFQRDTLETIGDSVERMRRCWGG